MVSVDKAVIARYEHKGKKFEILVDSEKALEFRKGSPYSLDNILAVQNVFKDAKTGEHVGSADLKEAFGTDDVLKACEFIIKNGDIQITSEQRRKLVDEKRKQIVSIIARNAINPQTDTPHPPARIEACMEQVRLKIDPFISAEEQVADVLKELKPLIPIRFEKKRVAAKFPVQYAPKSVGAVKRAFEIKQQAWLNDGSWVCEVEVPAGMVQDFIDLANRETHGNAEIKFLGEPNNIQRRKQNE